MLVAALTDLLLAVCVGLVMMTAYLVALSAVAVLWGAAPPPPDGPRKRRFAVLIPAHNEQQLIGRLLASLRAVDYPPDQVDMCVVADNCSDATAALARAAGALVYERHASDARGKGYALRWLLEEIAASGRAYDAFVVLDADSVVSPDFLRRLDARLEAGSQVVQVYYSVLNFAESPLAGLRSAALAAIHYVRPLARSRLGLSCGLKGNGMCFAAPILQRFGWRWYGLAEDVEFHLALVADGIRVDFAHETTVAADMPVTFGQATSQNQRWERGRIQLLRQAGPGLLAAGLRRRSLLRLDAVAEQLIPPLSLPFAAAILMVVLGMVLGSPLAAALGGISLLGQVVYIVAALGLVRASWRTYLALAYAPAYVAWKLAVYVRELVASRTSAWVRTARQA